MLSRKAGWLELELTWYTECLLTGTSLQPVGNLLSQIAHNEVTHFKDFLKTLQTPVFLNALFHSAFSSHIRIIIDTPLMFPLLTLFSCIKYYKNKSYG
jgi:hypothetical protein